MVLIRHAAWHTFIAHRVLLRWQKTLDIFYCKMLKMVLIWTANCMKTNIYSTHNRSQSPCKVPVQKVQPDTHTHTPTHTNSSTYTLALVTWHSMHPKHLSVRLSVYLLHTYIPTSHLLLSCLPIFQLNQRHL